MTWFIGFIILCSNAIVRAGEKRLEEGKRNRTGDHPRASRVWDHRWITFLQRKATNCWRNKRCENLLYRYSDWSPIMVLHRILTRSILRRPQPLGAVSNIFIIFIQQWFFNHSKSVFCLPMRRVGTTVRWLWDATVKSYQSIFDITQTLSCHRKALP